ncbi:fasciclin-2 isoform X3 [Aphidius gifuensis]|uniref:fasciclin-2 isoform X3 n=1 Tax=Aphidius gifuensis TaxID=684658 RepID=UPI001CDC843E|nr:fasciclin-2 isoform X3 [Aphidius gifuensis]
MASLSSGCSAAVAIVVLLHLATINAELEILPAGDVQSKPSGTQIMLTCKAKVENINLISNMEWRDPYDRVVSPLNLVVLPIERSKNKGGDNADMYTESQNGNLQLVFNSLKADQAGRYVCTATYANNEPLSKSVKIEIVDPITFTNAPKYQYPIINEEYTIQCQVTARPPPTVTWYRDDVPISSDENQYVVETHGLKIFKVQQSHEGVYRCRASVPETGSFFDRIINVEVHERPTIEKFKSNIEIIEGNNENINCITHGKPPPKVSWIKSITKENVTTIPRFGVDEVTGTMTITNVQSSDSGEYECIATNDAGSENEYVKIIVIEKPKIMDFLNRTVAEGKEVEITCKAFGRPPPEVVFKKQGQLLPFTKGIQATDDRIILSNIIDNAKGETVGSLNIQNAFRRDDGIYECIATNKVSSAYKNGHLTVEYAPSFSSMSNKTEWSWDGRPVNLSCIAESIPNATIRWRHNDRDIMNSELNNAAFTERGHGPISVLTITPFDRRYYGDYRCIATNLHGEASHVFHLREAQKPGPIEQVKITEITATTMIFDITLPSTDEDLPIDLIIVQWKLQDSPDWSNAKNKTWSPNSLYAVEYLEPALFYEFRFRAKNRAGEGLWTKNYIESTKSRSAPSQPKLITKSQNMEYELSPFSYQYEISWIKPQDNGDMIIRSKIHYCKITKNKNTNDWEVEKSTCSTEVVKREISSVMLRDLSPDTFYQAEIIVQNSLGESKPGVIKFYTAKASTMPTRKDRDTTSSLALIGVVIAAVFILIIVIDIICCCFLKIGVIFYFCERSKRKPVDEEDAKLGREEKEPLREEKKITPIIDTGLRRETSITFDGKRSVSKTGFVGKDSAV